MKIKTSIVLTGNIFTVVSIIRELYPSDMFAQY